MGEQDEACKPPMPVTTPADDENPFEKDKPQALNPDDHNNYTEQLNPENQNHDDKQQSPENQKGGQELETADIKEELTNADGEPNKDPKTNQEGFAKGMVVDAGTAAMLSSMVDLEKTQAAAVNPSNLEYDEDGNLIGNSLRGNRRNVADGDNYGDRVRDRTSGRNNKNDLFSDNCRNDRYDRKDRRDFDRHDRFRDRDSRNGRGNNTTMGALDGRMNSMGGMNNEGGNGMNMNSNDGDGMINDGVMNPMGGFGMNSQAQMMQQMMQMQMTMMQGGMTKDWQKQYMQMMQQMMNMNGGGNNAMSGGGGRASPVTNKRGNGKLPGGMDNPNNIPLGGMAGGVAGMAGGMAGMAGGMAGMLAQQPALAMQTQAENKGNKAFDVKALKQIVQNANMVGNNQFSDIKDPFTPLPVSAPVGKNAPQVTGDGTLGLTKENLSAFLGAPTAQGNTVQGQIPQKKMDTKKTAPNPFGNLAAAAAGIFENVGDADQKAAGKTDMKNQRVAGKPQYNKKSAFSFGKIAGNKSVSPSRSKKSRSGRSRSRSGSSRSRSKSGKKKAGKRSVSSGSRSKSRSSGSDDSFEKSALRKAIEKRMKQRERTEKGKQAKEEWSDAHSGRRERSESSKSKSRSRSSRSRSSRSRSSRSRTPSRKRKAGGKKSRSRSSRSKSSRSPTPSRKRGNKKRADSRSSTPSRKNKKNKSSKGGSKSSRSRSVTHSSRSRSDSRKKSNSSKKKASSRSRSRSKSRNATSNLHNAVVPKSAGIRVPTKLDAPIPIVQQPPVVEPPVQQNPPPLAAPIPIVVQTPTLSAAAPPALSGIPVLQTTPSVAVDVTMEIRNDEGLKSNRVEKSREASKSARDGSRNDGDRVDDDRRGGSPRDGSKISRMEERVPAKDDMQIVKKDVNMDDSPSPLKRDGDKNSLSPMKGEASDDELGGILQEELALKAEIARIQALQEKIALAKKKKSEKTLAVTAETPSGIASTPSLMMEGMQLPKVPETGLAKPDMPDLDLEKAGKESSRSQSKHQSVPSIRSGSLKETVKESAAPEIKIEVTKRDSDREMKRESALYDEGKKRDRADDGSADSKRQKTDKDRRDVSRSTSRRATKEIVADVVKASSLRDSDVKEKNSSHRDDKHREKDRDEKNRDSRREKNSDRDLSRLRREDKAKDSLHGERTERSRSGRRQELSRENSKQSPKSERQEKKKALSATLQEKLAKLKLPESGGKDGEKAAIDIKDGYKDEPKPSLEHLLIPEEEEFVVYKACKSLHLFEDVKSVSDWYRMLNKKKIELKSCKIWKSDKDIGKVPEDFVLVLYSLMHVQPHGFKDYFAKKTGDDDDEEADADIKTILSTGSGFVKKLLLEAQKSPSSIYIKLCVFMYLRMVVTDYETLFRLLAPHCLDSQTFCIPSNSTKSSDDDQTEETITVGEFVEKLLVENHYWQRFPFPNFDHSPHDMDLELDIDEEMKTHYNNLQENSTVIAEMFCNLEGLFGYDSYELLMRTKKAPFFLYLMNYGRKHLEVNVKAIKDGALDVGDEVLFLDNCYDAEPYNKDKLFPFPVWKKGKVLDFEISGIGIDGRRKREKVVLKESKSTKERTIHLGFIVHGDQKEEEAKLMISYDQAIIRNYFKKKGY